MKYCESPMKETAVAWSDDSRAGASPSTYRNSFVRQRFPIWWRPRTSRFALSREYVCA
ncbi:hypothetical protein C8E89_11644 [Mycolicibacterium moriokaense]|uniref:Uncharacterized protein n=1 Tax=Mycolicibacterium moriokaense TaxID=39691 RepID=A0A318HJ59_9MYCO|nr:hypothetical protein C8E89_11644 [Mycolicibacterium moriokaense]